MSVDHPTFDVEHHMTVRLRSGRPCIDFVHTGADYSMDFEAFTTAADVELWLPAIVGIRTPLIARAGDVPKVIALRTAIRACVVAVVDGKPPSAAAVVAVNTAASQPTIVPRLIIGGVSATEPASVTQVLSALARDAIDLLSSPYAERIRECASEHCGLFFVDTSRPNQRRWCSMELCGNRAKVRDFRDRKRGE